MTPFIENKIRNQYVPRARAHEFSTSVVVDSRRRYRSKENQHFVENKNDYINCYNHPRRWDCTQILLLLLTDFEQKIYLFLATHECASTLHHFYNLGPYDVSSFKTSNHIVFHPLNSRNLLCSFVHSFLRCCFVPSLGKTI